MGIQFDSRVVYRPEYNYPFSYYQSRIDQILGVYTDSGFGAHPDNIIELYEAMQYISHIDCDSGVATEQAAQYTAHIPEIKRVVGIYFSQITPENYMTFAEKIHSQYSFRFWELMCHYKKVEGITAYSLKTFLIANPHHLDDVLGQKEMAQHFSIAFYEYLIENPRYITIIVSALLAKKERLTKTLYVKAAFSPVQINSLFKQYIQHEPANINQLRLIVISQNDPEIGLDDEVRLMAKKKEAKLSEDLLTRGIRKERAFQVSFGPYDEWKNFKINNGEYSLMYDNRWISENLDYPTLLDNFICWLEYADLQCRSTLPLQKHHISALEDITIVKGKNTYDTGYGFKIVHFLQAIKMQAYCDQLKKHDIALEEIFVWFFEEYLPNEFSVDKFIYNAPTPESSYFEKCKLIASEIESVLKQFKFYQKSGHIDRELLAMSSEHLFFSQISSLLSPKYVYAKSERIQRCIHYLFDDSMLGFFPDNVEYEDCDCLYDAMIKYEQLPKCLFTQNYHKHPLHCLLEFGALIETDDHLTLATPKANILRELHNSRVICYQHSPGIQDAINELVATGDLFVESTLFSLPEQEYLDYILNKASFSNGLELRNKYMHGSKPKDDTENLNDYLEFLLIMVMIIIKINDEFCLKHPL